MPLQIIHQDITKLPVDAIVNTTNEEMIGYSGVDLAVHTVAGLGFVEIAQMQNVNNTTAWRRRKSIQKKYLRYVVMQG